MVRLRGSGKGVKMPLYQGPAKLDRIIRDNKKIMREVNSGKDYSKRTDLLAAALTCFAFCGIIIGFFIWR